VKDKTNEPREYCVPEDCLFNTVDESMAAYPEDAVSFMVSKYEYDVLKKQLVSSESKLRRHNTGCDELMRRYEELRTSYKVSMNQLESYIEIIHEMATNICRCPNDQCKGCGDSAVLIQKLCNDIKEHVEVLEKQIEEE